MPDGNGLDLLRKVKEENARIPVIMITGAHLDRGRRRGDEGRRRRLHHQALRQRRARPHRPPGARREDARGGERLPQAGARGALHLRQHHRQGLADAGDLPHDRADREGLLDGPHHGRERHGQGAHRARDPLHLDPQGAASSSRSTAARCRRRCSSPSSSATSAAPSPGAVKEKRGLFTEADDGTLFLDEISETSPTMQVKLLRAIQEKLIRKVGGNEETSASTSASSPRRTRT